MAGKAKNRDSNSVENDRLESKLTAGKVLYTDILNKVHKGNVAEMYKYIKKCYDKIDLYGDTPEKALENYCAFKSSILLTYYNMTI